MKKKHQFLSFVILSFASLFILTGCSSLSYNGDDFDKTNVQNVHTDEGLYFSTYKKSLENENIDVAIGVEKSAIEDVMIVYAKITNNSSVPYAVYNKDFSFRQDDRNLQRITPAQFINAYKSQEAYNFTGMRALAPTIASIATISNNLQYDNSNQAIVNDSNQKSFASQVESFVNGVNKFALASVSIVQPSESRYFYLFVQTAIDESFYVKYKDLDYSFAYKKRDLSD